VIARTNQVSHYILPAYAGLAEVYMGLWAANPGPGALQQEMRRRTESLCKLLSAFSRMYPIGEARTELVRGQYYRLTGREARARRAWRRGLAAAERYRMPYEQGQAHHELGRHGRPDDAESRTHLDRARELFGRMGIRHDSPGQLG